MSLRVDDRKSRTRSKSPGRERSRSRGKESEPSYTTAPVTAAAYAAAYQTRQPSYLQYAAPANVTGQNAGGAQGHQQQADGAITMGDYSDLPPEERPGYVPPGAQAPPAAPQPPAAGQYQYTTERQDLKGAAGYPAVQYANPTNWGYTATAANQPQGYTATAANQPQVTTRAPAMVPGVASAVTGAAPTPPAYAQTGTFQYAAPPDKITFTAKPVVSPVPPQPQPQPQRTHHYQQQQQQQQQQQYQQQQPGVAPYPQQGGYYQTGQQPTPQAAGDHQSVVARMPSPPSGVPGYGSANVIEVAPGGGRIGPPSPRNRPTRLSLSAGGGAGLGARMDRLSVSGNRPDIQTIVPGGHGALPPGSPMLEAYHGTYQSISPMPSPLMYSDDDLDDLPPLDPRASSSSVETGRKRKDSRARKESISRKDPKKAAARDRERERVKEKEKEKRVKIYDAEEDAKALVDAMTPRQPDAVVLTDILTQLSHDQMLELRREYKKHCKVQGHGINIAKHIKLRTSGNFGKICYVTALGRWESEGYWANAWYQSSNSRRELLIESLTGRPNHEIREIKDAFRDKRYGDSLVRCMDKELSADKFRKAILLALEGQRQEESEVWPAEDRNRDVDALHRALRSQGGETAMLEIVLRRSDAHLREVLRTFERKYQANFAREALRKSNNLVGEVIAHVLNGVINRPSRDAMLLHHALTDLIDPPQPTPTSANPDSSKAAAKAKHERQQRAELLMSRLVRLHWDRLHLLRVKEEYRDRYGGFLEADVEEATKGDYGEFCLALCETGR